jgi:hypothetical protein
MHDYGGNWAKVRAGPGRNAKGQVPLEYAEPEKLRFVSEIKVFRTRARLFRIRARFRDGGKTRR